VLVLSDGRIAISGGPDRFEILIYSHAYETVQSEKYGRKDHLTVVDSLDCHGMQVFSLLEVQRTYLIAIGLRNEYRVFYRNAAISSSSSSSRSVERDYTSGTQYVQCGHFNSIPCNHIGIATN
jgi:hypothetical protein